MITWKLIPGSGRVELSVEGLLDKPPVYLETEKGDVIAVRMRKEIAVWSEDGFSYRVIFEQVREKPN